MRVHAGKIMSAPGSPVKADWVLSLSGMRQDTCLRLPPIEPCVNKAVSHLRAIRERIAERGRTTATKVPSKSLQRTFLDGVPECGEGAALLDLRTATPKPILRTDPLAKKGEAGSSRRDSESTTVVTSSTYLA